MRSRKYFIQTYLNLFEHFQTYQNLSEPIQTNLNQSEPPTKKVVNFNMIFHESNKSIYFSKHQNKAEYKNLDDSKVLCSDFSDLKTSAASMTSTASTTSMASMTFTASFCQKHY